MLVILRLAKWQAFLAMDADDADDDEQLEVA
jgi:hypothetical protein